MNEDMRAVTPIRPAAPISAATEIFGRFAIEQVMTQYSVAGGKPSDVPEIVVTGPSAEPAPAALDQLLI